MRVLNLLQEMVAIRSVNPFKYFALDKPGGYVGLGAETAMNQLLEDLLRSAGFEVSRQKLHERTQLQAGTGTVEVPERWNVLGGRYPRSGKWNGKSILFFGHTDTVDVKQGWESDPFTITPRVLEGREVWFGLGANDMKGGLAAIIEAVQVAQASNYAIKVAFVVDEEFYSFGADALCGSDFLSDVSLAIAPEIGDRVDLDLFGVCDDHQQIGIGRTGRVEFSIEVIGRACHGADAFLSKEAVNAVHEAAKLQVAMIEDCARVRRVFSSFGAEALNSAYLSYHQGGEAMLSVPDRAVFVLDRTFLPDESPEAELSRLRELVVSLQRSGVIDPRAVISVTPSPRPTAPCKPYIFSPEVPEVARAVEVVKGVATSFSYMIGRSVADENRIAAVGIPTLTIGPVGGGSHTSREWVDPQSVVRVAAIFRNLVERS